MSNNEKGLLNKFFKIYQKKNKFYIIGTLKNKNLSTLKHEVAHGLFYTNQYYKNEILKILKQMDKKEKNKIKKFLVSLGAYHSSVLNDEIHTYLLDRRYLVANKITGRELELTGNKIKKVFNKYSP